MTLDEFLKLKEDLRARYESPLKAVRMSHLTVAQIAAAFPVMPMQNEITTLYGVPVEWDDMLNEGEYIPLYQ